MNIKTFMMTRLHESADTLISFQARLCQASRNARAYRQQFFYGFHENYRQPGWLDDET